jgi:amidophosphoribosyltransferase
MTGCQLLLQHRGQDAAGIVTQRGEFFMHKIRAWCGVFVPACVRCWAMSDWGRCVVDPAAPSSETKAQPFYVNAPFGLVLSLCNLTNAAELKAELFTTDHLATSTPTATRSAAQCCHELENCLVCCINPVDGLPPCWRANCRGFVRRGGVITGHSLLTISRPVRYPAAVHWPRPRQTNGDQSPARSVALEGTARQFERDIAPGETVCRHGWRRAPGNALPT